ncbi:hypothetical protein LIT13_06520 [Flavobacterium psychrophilum]|uniref:hypothetical protein n=1 Tax=Flavobacterium phage Fpv7 TaxID=1814287 RepID=UPI00078D46AA|nr:hypothetical protein [Flavobacterium psychrophilum]YP_009321225.1 hypothetical protein BOW77_gp20 [Flavobacterium phage Fpv7]YP_009322291.1 hypothetical protein BOW76_gp20 [Flavobacterium phage Fpv8]YP_009322397.1 hypothetical protein BOW79_gp20 [Flavobacterium phage Fpv5]YP_009323691.1 hypothetical protein BOW72_gp20 [Flavobacterium phage Fpv10]YP_009324543.1 hypothetical protein BOW78_gp20 [Flavobacterium phage Fpv6]YP_009325231.1 hypothetical protein BOW83_gp20 [Flavobacterium phage Fpv
MENVKKTSSEIQSYDLLEELPNLQSAKILPIDLTSEYWTPEKEGETKLCFFQDIKSSSYTDEQTGETIELPCIIFLEQKETGELKTFRNGSKRLVASLQSAMNSGKIVAGTPLRIEYLGKQKNSTNAFKSDIWSVKPLIIQDDEAKEKELDKLFSEKETLIPADDFEHIKRIIENKEITSYDKTLKFLRNL